MTSAEVSQPVAQDDLDRTARTRRIGLATAMLTAPWFIVAANTGHTVVTIHGGDDIAPRQAIELVSGHLTLYRWSTLAAMLGSLLLVPAVLGVMRLVRTRGARLGLVGGVLMAAGYICYFAMTFHSFTTVAMVSAGGSTAQNIAVLQAGLDEPLTLWVYLLFVLGNVVGTFLLGLALVRARTAGRSAGFALMGWSVLHVVSFPTAEVVGAVLQALGFALAARALLHRAAPPAAGTTPETYELLRR